MQKLFRLLVVTSMVAALTVTGYAKPGNGNGGGRNQGRGHNKPPKPPKPENPGRGNGHGRANSDTATSSTFALGTITCTDSRILDLSGDYVLSGTLTGSTTTGSIALSIVQDDRGRLATSSTVELADGTTTDVLLSGHLQLTAQTNLRVQMEGYIGVDDGVSSYTKVKLRGYWNGTSFDTTVTIVVDGVESTFETEIVPVNPLRGFTILGGEAVKRGKGNGPAFSERTVLLPWGTETVRARQHNKKRNFMFKMNSGNFGLDLRGTANSSGLSLYWARVHLGYGSLMPPIDMFEVTESIPAEP